MLLHCLRVALADSLHHLTLFLDRTHTMHCVAKDYDSQRGSRNSLDAWEGGHTHHGSAGARPYGGLCGGSDWRAELRAAVKGNLVPLDAARPRAPGHGVGHRAHALRAAVKVERMPLQQGMQRVRPGAASQICCQSCKIRPDVHRLAE